MSILPGYRLKRRASPGDLARISFLLIIVFTVPLAITYALTGRSYITFFVMSMDGIAVIISIVMNLLGSPFNYGGVDDELGIVAGTFLERVR